MRQTRKTSGSRRQYVRVDISASVVREDLVAMGEAPLLKPAVHA
jgi:hypothetical protein